MKPLTWTLAAFGALAVVAVLMICTGIAGADLIFFLLFGWFPFLGRSSERLTIRWDVVASTTVYLLALAIGSHLFLRWLWREIKRTDGAAAPTPWRLRWTLSSLAIIVLMFAAGTAVVGVTHQVAWLATSPESMWRKGSPSARRIQCASNLRQIGLALQVYANDHEGRLPDDFSPLAASDDLSARVFICPETDHEPATGATPQEVAANLLKPGHCSYVYFGKGLRQPIDNDRVLAIDLPDNHDERPAVAINVLYGDGHVEFVRDQQATELLKKMGLQQPGQTQPIR